MYAFTENLKLVFHLLVYDLQSSNFFVVIPLKNFLLHEDVYVPKNFVNNFLSWKKKINNYDHECWQLVFQVFITTKLKVI